MPRLSRIRTPAIEELVVQLRFAPRPAIDRHIAAAESLVGVLEPGTLYPEVWLIEQMTGYKPSEAEHDRMLVGEAILGDLSAMVERLSSAGGHTAADAGPGAMDSDALGERWSISRKTLDRYRRLGLIARRVIGPDGHARILYPAANIERFERAHPDRIGNAASFSRLDERDRRELLGLARSHAEAGRSLNESAAILAEHTGRSHEGIRQLLKRADAASDRPLFGAPGPPTARQQKVAWRAMRRGIEPGVLASRWGKNRAAVTRAANVQRLRLLHGLGPASVTPEERAPTAGAIARIPPPENLASLWLSMQTRPSLDAGAERALARTFHAYRSLADERIVLAGGVTPSGGALDEAECALRWAARAGAALVGAQLHLVRTTMESRDLTPDRSPADELRNAMTRGVVAIADALTRHDPTRGGRLASPAGLALNRLYTAARGHDDPAADRARRRLTPDEPAPDWPRLCFAWQAWLEPDPRVVRLALDPDSPLDDRDRMVLGRRFALDGDRPDTLAELGERLGVPRVHAARFERGAIRNALALARLA